MVEFFSSPEHNLVFAEDMLFTANEYVIVWH